MAKKALTVVLAHYQSTCVLHSRWQYQVVAAAAYSSSSESSEEDSMTVPARFFLGRLCARSRFSQRETLF